MKATAVAGLALGLTLATGAAHAAGTAVPLLYRSDPTDAAAAPRVLAARDRSSTELAARLQSAPGGRVVVSFDRVQGPGRYVFLGFSFETASPYAVGVRSDRPLTSVAVIVDGRDLPSVSGAPDRFATPVTRSGRHSVVVRLERGETSQVPVTVSLHGFEACASLLANPCGRVFDTPPSGLKYELSPPGDAAAPADVLIPAIVRAGGLHGPVRSDVSFVNSSDSTISASLSLVMPDRGVSPARSIELAPHARLKIEDVVKYVLGDGTDGQGALAVRGLVPLSPGGISAETYYENGSSGRVGTTLPLFFDRGVRDGSSILAASTEGDPRLILFSSAARGGGLASHVANIRVQLGGGAPLAVPVDVSAGVYATARLSDLIGQAPGDGLVSVETDDQSIHAILVRSDPASGSPFVLASN